MSDALSIVLAWLLKAGVALVAFNEIRGLILAGPVLYGMYQAGGTLTAVWLGFCSLAGIGLSIFVPLIVAKRAEQKLRLRVSSRRVSAVSSA